MTTVVIVIHLMVVVAMIGLVLLQRSEGGALGIGGAGAFMTGRGAANMLTRSTGILAAAFFATSVALALLGRLETTPSDIFQNLPGQAAPTPETAETPAPPVPSGGGSAADMLKDLGGAGGPQTPPAEGGAGGAAQPQV
ncbi:MAG: preprotein translocase subunit SecG, partial [Propylenella sp.]